MGHTKVKSAGVEEEDSPLAGDVGVAYFFERSVMECLNLEFRRLCVDNGLHIDNIFESMFVVSCRLTLQR